MADLTKIDLDPNLDPWDQQPGETAKRFKAFEEYRELGRGRTLYGTAKQLGKTKRYLRDLSIAGRWQERVDAWDARTKQIYDGEHDESTRKVARQDGAVLSGSIALIGASLQQIRESGEPLTVEQTIRLMDVTLKHRRQLYGDPTTISGSGSSGPGSASEPIQVSVSHFAEMPREGKLNAIRDLMEENERWLAAARNTDDD